MWEDYSQTEELFFYGILVNRRAGVFLEQPEVGRLHKGVSQLISGMAN